MVKIVGVKENVLRSHVKHVLLSSIVTEQIAFENAIVVNFCCLADFHHQITKLRVFYLISHNYKEKYC